VRKFTCICVRILTCTCVRILTCTCVRKFTCICVRMLTSTCVRKFTCICVRILTCTCVCILTCSRAGWSLGTSISAAKQQVCTQTAPATNTTAHTHTDRYSQRYVQQDTCAARHGVSCFCLYWQTSPTAHFHSSPTHLLPPAFTHTHTHAHTHTCTHACTCITGPLLNTSCITAQPGGCF